MWPHALGARGEHFVLGGFEQRHVRRVERGFDDAQHILARQGIGIAVVDEIAALGHAK
jgi:hypothetical protein